MWSLLTSCCAQFALHDVTMHRYRIHEHEVTKLAILLEIGDGHPGQCTATEVGSGSGEAILWQCDLYMAFQVMFMPPHDLVTAQGPVRTEVLE